MIYQYDQALQLPTVDLYDTQIMAMALNAAKDMYERGEQQIKDFQKAYGDFLTPITADQNWWNQNVTGAARDLVNSIYARGGDPLRNARDRAQISMFLNRLPYGDMAKLKSSAKNAEAYLEARRKLELEGKYNPAIEQYAGKGLDQFSTVNDGIWDRMSPVPYENMADFSKAYFDNISPIQRSATKNGISYSISEITEPMLQDIADRHFNDLVNTPQGRLMYQMYLNQSGGDAKAARQAFNNAVVSGNLDRRKYADDYNVQKDKAEDRALKRRALSLQEQNFALKKKIAEAKLNNQNSAKSWTERQRIGVMNNHNYKADLRLDLAKAKSGTTTAGAKMQLVSEGISNPTNAQIQNKIKENKALLRNQELYAKYYGSYTTNVEGGDLITARALFAGLSKEEAVGDIAGIKRKPVQFNPKSNLTLTSLRERDYGGVRLKETTDANILQDYLDKNHIQGHVPYDIATVSYKDYAPGRGVFDVNSTVRIKASDFDKLGNGNAESRRRILESNGATLLTTGGKVVSKDQKIAWSNIEYIELPVSRSFDSHSYTDSEINTYHEALNYTKTIAKKEQSGFENDDLTNIILDE